MSESSNGLGGIASGIATLFSKRPTKPGDAADLSARGALKGYYNTAQPFFNLNSLLQPAYLGLGSSNLQDLLFGQQGGQRSVQVGWGKPNADGTFDRYKTLTLDTPASVGLLDTIGSANSRLQDIYNQGAQRGIQNNLGLLNSNLGAALDFYNQSNPEVAGLRTRLAAEANRNLSLGGAIDPAMSRSITQGVRSDWANRGLGQTMPAQLGEALQLYAGGEGLRQARTGQAQSLTNTLASTAPDFTKFILGLGGNPAGDAMNFINGQQNLAYQGNKFDPYNNAAASLSGAAERNRMIDQQQRANAWGSIIGGAADVAGGFLSGGGLGVG